ncbi:MAG: single-stranded DNA-binding protein [Ferruginibacter sp.]|uniref:single-stranded DNA-binding protein n=1 Tax=Ferruginibacter sp. TaxID=1940288 RepID=UPI00265B10F7|nr:single-stranded DNA-binding protein [Ferruginibacter sp.]MDB5277941.1 single-stranded DNA-binding protein [Ferruginibacter sp.]
MEITARLTADAVITTIKDNKQVVNFTAAINQSYRAKGSTELTKITTYVKCSYWINTTVAQWLTKGALVELQGMIGVQAWKGRDGQPKATLTFHVNHIHIHERGKAAQSEEDNAQDADTQGNPEPTDDLPF